MLAVGINNTDNTPTNEDLFTYYFMSNIKMKFTAALSLLYFGINLVLGESDDSVMACVELFKPAYVDEMCCQSLQSINTFDEDIKECNKKESAEEWTCADYECFLDKRGLLDNGKIIDEKASAFLDDIVKKFPKEKNIIERVKMGCLEGQYEEYPPDENCMALRFYVCVYTNVMLECDSWKNTQICNEASDLVKKCKEAK